MLKELQQILQPQRLTHIVDVGANPIDGDPPYQALLKNGLCSVVGFEPQPDALAALNQKNSRHAIYLPYAVGDGTTKTLNVCRYSGWTSTLTPDRKSLDLFRVYRENAEIIGRIPVATKRLDDIAEIEHMDLLKIDIQGGELDVFRNAVDKLSRAVAVQTEVSFVNMYEKQPTIGELDVELRRQGFIPQCFASIRSGMISPLTVNNDPWQGLHQLLEADMVYVRDFRDPVALDDEQLKHLCLIADACYGSFDLAYRCLSILERNKSIAHGSAATYVGLLNSPPGAPGKYSVGE